MVNRSYRAGVDLNFANLSSLQCFITPPRKHIGLFQGGIFGVAKVNRPNMGKCKTPPPNFTALAHNQDVGVYITQTSPSQKLRGGSPKAKSLSPSTMHAKASPLYAGAKFSDPPAPNELPKPPPHWMKEPICNIRDCNVKLRSDGMGKNCTEMTNGLKILLNVQA